MTRHTTPYIRLYEPQPGFYPTIEEIQKANKAAGYFFFSPATMRGFKSRVLPTVYHGRFFLTTEQMEEDTPRTYTIREARPNGNIVTIGEFGGYTTKAQALHALTTYINRAIDASEQEQEEQ